MSYPQCLYAPAVGEPLNVKIREWDGHTVNVGDRFLVHAQPPKWPEIIITISRIVQQPPFLTLFVGTDNLGEEHDLMTLGSFRDYCTAIE